jgi:hypothetical protein
VIGTYESIWHLKKQASLVYWSYKLSFNLLNIAIVHTCGEHTAAAIRSFLISSYRGKRGAIRFRQNFVRRLKPCYNIKKEWFSRCMKEQDSQVIIFVVIFILK